MKKTWILNLFLCLVCSSVLYAQTNVTVNVTNKPIKDVISLIQDQVEYSFLYNTKLVNVEKRVTVEFNNVSLSNVLDKVFTENGITWKIADKQIVLSVAE